MPTRIPASEPTSQKLEELLTQGVADGDARAELLKLAVRKIVEEALEAEAVGRDYYETGAAPGAGYRNGYRRGRLRTEGEVSEPFFSVIVDKFARALPQARRRTLIRAGHVPQASHPVEYVEVVTSFIEQVEPHHSREH